MMTGRLHKSFNFLVSYLVLISLFFSANFEGRIVTFVVKL